MLSAELHVPLLDGMAEVKINLPTFNTADKAVVFFEVGGKKREKS